MNEFEAITWWTVALLSSLLRRVVW